MIDPRLFMALVATGLLCAAPSAAQWLYYGGDQQGRHHSSLDQINTTNVAELELAWTYRTGALARHPDRASAASFHATPLMLPPEAGGALVFCTPYNRIVALDPTKGTERWTYDSEPDLGTGPVRYNCRGIAYWRDATALPGAPCAHRLFMGTTDLRLVAIDARTGDTCSAFGQDGEVNIKIDVMAEVTAKAQAIGRPADYRHGDVQFASPPVVIADTVIVGSSNNTKFRRADGPSGRVRAFNARSGKPSWTFDPVPRNPGDAQAANWSEEALKITGAANVWSMMSVDAERGLVFLPTASASPDFFGGTRPGDNRYANSVVALNGASGEIVWHYQIVHHDVWDLDLPAQPILTDIDHAGERIPVVVQLTKQGLIFVLHRETGEPVFPVEERPVPTDGVPGDVLSPTQPFPSHPPPLVAAGIGPDDAWGFTMLDRGKCRDMIAAARYGEYYAPPSRQGTVMFPGMGVNNWGGGAISPDGNVIVVPINRAPILRGLIPLAELNPDVLDAPMAGLMGNPGRLDGTGYAQVFKPLLSPLFSPCTPPPWGELAAVDLSAGKIIWRRNLGVLDKLMPVPIPLNWGTPNAGGPIMTAGGLVFIGATMDERFRAFDTNTGEMLWETVTPTASMATPMTYEINGRQFVVIASGGHMWQYGFKLGDWLVAYALPD